jgi:glycine hydroxymethyltransferase
VSATGIYYDSHPYHVRPDGYIDFDDVWRLAREHRPKLIWCGGTAYAREYPFAALAEVADEVGAFLAADVAHIAGLIVGGVHPSPTPHVHVITTTTHKTLRGPRGAMIMVTDRGIAKDAALPERIDKAVFPGLQGGPHDHTTAAIAAALGEAMQPGFASYAAQVVRNAKALGAALAERGFTLVTGGTDNHLLLVDLTSDGIGRGVFMQEALDAVGITVNKNTIPNEPSSAFYPSGIRCGTPAATTRGLREGDMAQIAAWMAAVRDEATEFILPQDRAARTQVLRHFRIWITTNARLASIRDEVRTFCRRFPVPGITPV